MPWHLTPSRLCLNITFSMRSTVCTLFKTAVCSSSLALHPHSHLTFTHLHTHNRTDSLPIVSSSCTPFPIEMRFHLGRDLCLFVLWCIPGFPGGSDGKESASSEGDLGLIPGLGRSPGGDSSNPFQYSCLENPHGQRSLAALRGAWQSMGLQRVG